MWPVSFLAANIAPRVGLLNQLLRNFSVAGRILFIHYADHAANKSTEQEEKVHRNIKLRWTNGGA